MDKICENCIFFNMTADPQGECRRSQPQVYFNISILTAWPIVSKTEWCGEWVAEGANPNFIEEMKR